MSTDSTSSEWRERRCEGGLHLFHRASGLNVLLDEIVMPAESLARAPRYVSIALTNACDLRCGHCYAPKRAARLDTNAVERWLLQLDANGCLGVGFGGGEPTLHPAFASLCRFAAAEAGLAVTFTTHAHHLDEQLLEQLRGHIHLVRVSMDGVGRTYEEVRGRPFAQLLRRIVAVRRAFRFGINFVVNERTLADLDAAAVYAADLGAAELLLLPERPTLTTPGLDEVTSEQMSEWVSGYTGSVPLTVSEAGAPALPFFTPVPGETGLRAYVHVDASGVLKTTLFDHDGVLIGEAGVVEAFTHLQQRSAGGHT